MLKKLLFGFAALFLILVGSLILMMGYVFNHPQSIFDAFNSVTSKLTQGEPYEEKSEFFLQGIKTLHFTSGRANLQVIPYDGPTLKMELTGKIPRFERGPFIAQGGSPTHLVLEIHEPLASNWVHININGHESSSVSDSSLLAKIYLPKTYQGEVTVENIEGSVEVLMPKGKLYEFDLQSGTGKIDNQIAGQPLEGINPAEVGKMHIVTTSGNILIKNAF
ncbi:MAG TPA: hypothetical protein VF412_01240 [Bdellovibrio sp.]|uniref:hypothetical protein n=1 Tax=Bdellovibrio sp. TaxID=28201 RepID=UPI002F088060